jgi:Meiotically up-regulated gene 113
MSLIAKAHSSKPGYVYVIGCEGSPLVKIGYTRLPLWKLRQGLQRGSPLLLKVLAAQHTPVPEVLEELLHRRFEIYRVRVGGNMEWFCLPDHYLNRLIKSFNQRKK